MDLHLRLYSCYYCSDFVFMSGQAFYGELAPEKAANLVPMIVDDFVSRGATHSELMYLNKDLYHTYGRDLTSVGQSVRHWICI